MPRLLNQKEKQALKEDGLTALHDGAIVSSAAVINTLRAYEETLVMALKKFRTESVGCQNQISKIEEVLGLNKGESRD